jgi:hypothetical protein
MSSAPSGTSLGSEVYSGVAVYGRFRAVVGAVIGVIIALLLIIIGFSKLRDKHTASASMTVTAVRACVAPPAGGGQGTATMYACTVDVSFSTPDGKAFHAAGVKVTVPAQVIQGDVLVLRYDPANPSDVVQEVSPRTAGWAMIGGGALVGVTAVGIAVLSFKSKGFAAIEGTAGLIGDVGAAFSSR